LLSFFFVNFISHAATVPAQPGAKLKPLVINAVLALLLPFAGLGGSLFSLGSFWAAHQKDKVHQAVAARALLVVCRLGDWEPVVGDKGELKDVDFTEIDDK
jgi:hypothetical protein